MSSDYAPDIIPGSFPSWFHFIELLFKHSSLIFYHIQNTLNNINPENKIPFQFKNVSSKNISSLLDQFNQYLVNIWLFPTKPKLKCYHPYGTAQEGED